MSEYFDEIEQGQAVKKWFRENGTSLVVGVGLGLAGIYGWQQFQSWQVSSKSAASSAFREMVTSLQSDDVDGALAKAQSVRSEFSGSPYAALTALEQAKLALDQDDVDAAIGHLQFAVDNARPNAVASVARVRLARLLLSADRTDEALAAIDAVDSPAYTSTAAEVRGDIYLSMDRSADALSAYQDAMAALEGGSGNRQILQMKIDDLRTEDTETASEVEEASS